MPAHGDRSKCKTCGGAVEYVVYSSPTSLGTEEVHDAWWAHEMHPLNGHDAVVDDAER